MDQHGTTVSVLRRSSGLVVADMDEERMLVQLDEARQLIEIVSTSEDAKFLYDGFTAAQVLARRRGYSQAARVATEGRIRAGRKLGEFIPREFPPGNVAADQTSARTRLADIGVSYDQSSRYQKLAVVPEEIFAEIIDAADREQDGELSEAGVLDRAERILRGRNVQQSENNEWYTPACYIDAVHAALGGIDLDPASSEIANATVRAKRFYTAEDDGLSHPWIGRVYLNPPYGRLAGAFVERLADEHETGRVTAAIVLVNAHCTDTAWFQRLWSGVLCFTDHRIDFERPSGKTRNQSTHGSAFAYVGANELAFADAFAPFGAIVRRFP
jgi:phage N-6-adenine-methyltransferase